MVHNYYDEYQKLKKKGKAPESIEEKNTSTEFLDHFIYYNFASDKLIHPVNNLICTGSKHNQASLDLRKKLLLSIKGQIKSREVKIPVHQYLFDVLVKNQIMIKSSGKESHGVLIISSLQKFTLYTFTVSAGTIIQGFGPDSQLILVRTLNNSNIQYVYNLY